jgi:hypothetical protein
VTGSATLATASRMEGHRPERIGDGALMQRATALATLLLWGVASALAGAEPTARVFVLDAGAPALVSVDLAAGKRLASLPLEGRPTWLIQSDDGHYLVLLDYGPGEDKAERGYKAKGRSSATIVDASRFTIIGRVELGFGLRSALTGPDGRLTVTCPGYDAKKPSEALPRELVVVDLASARETGRLRLEPGTDLTWRSHDGRELALLLGLPRSKRYPYPNARITLVDVESATVTATLDAAGWDWVERDGERLYLISLGKPHNDPKKNENGSVDVISLAERHVDRLDIGRSPVATLLGEDGLFAVAGQGPAGRSGGELRLVREGALAAMLPVAAHPKWLGEVGEALCVVGSKAVTLVGRGALQVTATIPLERDGRGVIDEYGRPFEVLATSDGRRAFIHYRGQEKVVVLDLEHGKALGSAKTGRGGKRFLNFVTSSLKTFGDPSRPRLGDAPQMLLRPDGRFAYALNVGTSDVTVVDADTAAVVGRIGVRGLRLAPLSGSTLAVLGSELHLIDTARNVKIGEAELPGLQGFQRSADGAYAVALARGTVLILDGTTGKGRTRLGGFVDPTRMTFATEPEPSEPPTP